MLNEASIALIKEFEGCKLTAYLCPANVLTIGYGHTSRAGEPQVTRGMTITEEEAEQILRADLRQFEEGVRAGLKRPINGNQLGAFVSLAYNIGVGAFRKSTALKRFNAGDFAGAAEAMTWWNKAGGKVLKGLVRRREAERALFLTPIEAIEEAPEPGAMPREGVSGGEAKSLGKSKTVGLGTVILGGAAGEALGVFSELREVIPEVAAYAPYVLAGLALLVILNRWNDSRRGVH